jgi:hypothetical protein
VPTTSSRPIRFWVLCAALLLLAALTPCCMFAQSESASVSGRVTDQTNAVVPDVEVELRNADTGVSQATKTNGEGFYVFPYVKPGNYIMSVRKQSFQTVSVTGMTLNVQDNLSRNFVLQVGSSAESITVNASDLHINTTDASVGTVIDRNFAESLPLNGRSFNTLLQLTPGVVIAPTAGLGGAPGQFSISGQRSDANIFSVDGVSANFGVSNGSVFTNQSGTGTDQAFSALGGTSSLVSVEALQEFRVETSSFAPEFGRTPGGQVIITTRSGTNDFHGGIYEYFRNDVMDANDWFANASAGSPHAPERHNDFGGYLGGPILKQKTFFFFSYEGARLRLPQSLLTQVPSNSIRTASTTPTQLVPFLNAFPLPNGPVSAAGDTAQFTAVYSASATLNATSLRIDHNFNDKFSFFGRYNYAPSQLARRPSGTYLQTGPVDTQTATVGVNMLLSPQLTNTVRGNYSTQKASLVAALDSFGGGVPLNPSLLGASNNSLGELVFLAPQQVLQIGPLVKKKATQWNFVDDLSITTGTHQIKFGGDYRAILLDSPTQPNSFGLFAFTVAGFVSSGTANFLSAGSRTANQLLAQAFSAYAQDTWNISPRMTMTYGLRWDLSPAPSPRGATILAAWENVTNPAAISLAPKGTPPWKTTYGNFAPRLGVAYKLNDHGDLVLRVGGGIFYDLGTGSAANLGDQFPNAATGFHVNIPVPVTNFATFTPPPVSFQPPFPNEVFGFARGLELPRSYQWNLAVEKSFGERQVITLTYVGQAGRKLLRQDALFKPNSNFLGVFAVTDNSARSNYNALQLQYRRPLSARLQVLANYTWSHSLDNSSNDVVAGVSNTVISAANDYASSDFDVRQSFSTALTYDIPSAGKSGLPVLLTKGWSLDTVIVARTGFPFNGTISQFTVAGANPRPNVVPSQPFWISNATAGGGKSLNPAAFTIPPSGHQGTEGRNDIPGFGFTQVDLSLGRKFPITERMNLQFRADAFNLLNHPNFANPLGCVICGSSGLASSSMLNQALGGLNPLFQEGGPRSLQLSLKLSF